MIAATETERQRHLYCHDNFYICITTDESSLEDQNPISWITHLRTLHAMGRESAIKVAQSVRQSNQSHLSLQMTGLTELYPFVSFQSCKFFTSDYHDQSKDSHIFICPDASH